MIILLKVVKKGFYHFQTRMGMHYTLISKHPVSCKSPASLVMEYWLHNVIMTVSYTLPLQQVVDTGIHHDSM